MATLQFLRNLPLPKGTRGKDRSSCKTLWAFNTNDALAVAGAIEEDQLLMSSHGHDAANLTPNESLALASADVAHKLGFVKALKEFMPEKYEKFVAIGRAIRSEEPTIEYFSYGKMKSTCDDVDALESKNPVPTEAEIDAMSASELACTVQNLTTGQIKLPSKQKLRTTRKLVKIICKSARAQRELLAKKNEP